MAAVPSAALGAGPADAGGADGFVQGSHLFLQLQQPESRGGPSGRRRKTAPKAVRGSRPPLGTTRALFSYDSLFLL